MYILQLVKRQKEGTITFFDEVRTGRAVIKGSVNAPSNALFNGRDSGLPCRVDDNNKTHPKGVDEHNQNVVAQEDVTMMNKGDSALSLHGVAHTTTKRTRKGVDELSLYVVAQGNVTMTSKCKATFRLPTVRCLHGE